MYHTRLKTPLTSLGIQLCMGYVIQRKSEKENTQNRIATFLWELNRLQVGEKNTVKEDFTLF